MTKEREYDSTPKYYVYHIINPKTGSIIYVGKGTGNRYKQHLTDKKEYASNKRLNGYIRNLMEEGNPPKIIKVAENLTEFDAYELEEEHIKQYGRIGFDEGGILLNILESGRPPSAKGEDHPWYGRKHKPESIEKAKQTIKLKRQQGLIPSRRGFKHTEEAKEKNRQAHLGKKRTPEAIEKTRQANLGRPQTDFQKQRAREANQRIWLVITPNGDKEIVINLRKYSLERGLDPGNMMHVASGRFKQYKGYKVIRLPDDFVIPDGAVVIQ